MLCEVMFKALGYLGEYLDLRDFMYKSHNTILTARFLPYVVKTGSKYQILSTVQKKEK
jgi:hypothetical protein